MSNYILSTDNRFYAAIEAGYGAVAQVSALDRLPAVKLSAKQTLEKVERRDKTGGRSFSGLPAAARKQTSYQLKTYMTSWTESAPPGYGPLIQAAMAAEPMLFSGAVVSAGLGPSQLRTSTPHGLAASQAITLGGDIRIVTAIVDALTFEVNAPFTIEPVSGSQLGRTLTYTLGSTPTSVSIMDYWGNGGVSRIVQGAAVNRMTINVNSDFHELEFSGPARDLLDDASFVAGQGDVAQFPGEPQLTFDSSSVIPGHVGQVWLGSDVSRFYTLTDGSVTLDNDVETRAKEFGADGPRGIVLGRRTVGVTLAVYEQDDAATKSLYQAARQRSPISVFFQLGEQPGELVGVYMKSVIPEVPEFDDGDRRVQWEFTNCRAQGTADDELVVALG